MMNKKEKKEMKAIKILLWTAFVLMIFTGIGLTYSIQKQQIFFLRGVYVGGGLNKICDSVNSSINTEGECILGGYYNERGLFKKYRHHYSCSWGDFDIGATYVAPEVSESIAAWFLECDYSGYTEIDKEYNIFNTNT